MATLHPDTDRRHERSDVSVRLIGISLGLFAAAGLVVYGVLSFYWRMLQANDAARPSISRWHGPRELPPSPRLQTSPRIDLREFLREERKKLDTPGAGGMPIDKAIDEIAGRGLPYRQAPQDQSANTDRRFGHEPAAR